LKELKALSDRYTDEQNWLNYRSASICTVMANAWRGPKSRAFTLEDFMPKYESKKQTPEQMLAAVRLLNSAYGGNYIERE